MSTPRSKAIRHYGFKNAIATRQKEDKNEGDAYKSGTYMQNEVSSDDDEAWSVRLQLFNKNITHYHSQWQTNNFQENFNFNLPVYVKSKAL